MSNVYMLGFVPIPGQNSKRVTANGFRTWQFISAAVLNGHNVHLIALNEDTEHYYKKTTKKNFTLSKDLFKSEIAGIKSSKIGKITFKVVDREKYYNIPWHNIQIKKYNSHSLVTAGTHHPLEVAWQLNNNIPKWIDVPGDPFSEAQVKASKFNDDDLIEKYVSGFCSSVKFGDRFSAISTPQAHALIGQIGFTRRLTSLSLGINPVQVIPPAVPITKFSTNKSSKFQVVTGGGFHPWLDPLKLWKTIELSLIKNDSLTFVITGGSIPGHDQKTFNTFCNYIKCSDLKERICILGWINENKLIELAHNTLAFLNIDSFYIESILGSRNRLVFWSSHSVPCITTCFCELEFDMIKNNAAYKTDGTAESVANILGKLINKIETNKENIVSNNAHNYVINKLNVLNTTLPLIKWLHDPVRLSLPLKTHDIEFQELRTQNIKLNSQLAKIWDSPIWKISKKIKKIYFTLKKQKKTC